MTLSTVFDHRGRAQKNGNGPLEIRITINRRVYYINTGIRIKASQFRFGSIINHDQSNELNERVRILISKIEREINSCIDNDCNLDIAKLRKIANSTPSDEKKNNTLLEWIDEQIQLLNIAHGTRKHYKKLLVALYDYGKLTSFSDLTPEALYKLDAHLHSRKKRQTEVERMQGKQPEYISDAGVFTYHKCLKALLNRAVLFGVIDSNPYSRMRGQFKRGDRESVEYLTEEEMQAFMSLSPVPGSQMSIARDLFVIQMFTGLAYTDMQTFDFSHYKLVDGAYQYSGTRVKTGVPFVGQLLPPVVEVLERYGWRVPKMNNADYNHALKALGMAAGIETSLHSHLARHTFATYMLRNGVRIENVSKMLGHTNITQTQRYAKVLAQSIHDDFAMIAEKMKKGE
jgi:integrase